MRYGGLSEFVSFLRKRQEEERRWEYFLHRYRGGLSFEAWKEELNSYGR